MIAQEAFRWAHLAKNQLPMQCFIADTNILEYYVFSTGMEHIWTHNLKWCNGNLCVQSTNFREVIYM